MIRVKSQDFWAGILFLAIGLSAAWFGRVYTFGTATRMGPGYLPTVLAWGLAGMGLLLVVRALIMNSDAIERSLIRPQIFIIIAIIVFGFLIEPLGLAPTIAIISVIASFASTETRWKEVIALSIGLAIMCSVLFVYLLGQPLTIWNWGY